MYWTSSKLPHLLCNGKILMPSIYIPKVIVQYEVRREYQLGIFPVVCYILDCQPMVLLNKGLKKRVFLYQTLCISSCFVSFLFIMNLSVNEDIALTWEHVPVIPSAIYNRVWSTNYNIFWLFGKNNFYFFHSL